MGDGCFGGSLCSSVSPVVMAFSWGRKLFLEQILKRRPCVGGPSARGSGGFLLAGHANLVESALIPFVFLCDALLHRLHALESAAGIEVGALFARVQRKIALRTVPFS